MNEKLESPKGSNSEYTILIVDNFYCILIYGEYKAFYIYY